MLTIHEHLATVADQLVSASAPVAFAIKGTALLGIAWMIHAALTRANPRWRVLLWRGTALGLVVLPFWIACGPVFKLAVVTPPRAIEPSVPWRPANFVDRTREPRVSAVEKAVRTAVEERPSLPASPQSAAQSASELRSGPPHEVRMEAETPAPTEKIEAVKTLPILSVRTTAILMGLIWLVGFALTSSRTIVGHWRIAMLVRKAQTPAPQIAGIFRQVVSALPSRRTVALKTSPEAHTPFLCGFQRDTIVLPETFCRPEYAEDLPAIFAHELSHVESRDVIWNTGLRLFGAAFWFHPLAWRVPAAHAAACELVGDGVAAGFVGAAAYARTLARVALAILSPPPAAVLAIARSSTISRRLDALERGVNCHRPHRGQVLAIGLAATGAFCACAGLALGYGPPETAPKSSPTANAAAAVTDSKPNAPRPRAAASETEFLAIDTVKNQPLRDVRIKIAFFITTERKFHEASLVTDAKGRVEWTPPADVDDSRVGVNARIGGYVHIYLRPVDQQGRKRLPGQVRLEFVPGTVIGGFVRDPQGKPVAKASVSIAVRTAINQPYLFEAGSAKTDERGYWRCDTVPKHITETAIRVTHPDFSEYARQYAGFESPFLRLTAVITVTPKKVIRGHVTDEQGRPVANAPVVYGDQQLADPYPSASTDAHGNFVLKEGRIGPMAVTVQAAGFAPELRELSEAESMQVLEFRLKPPHTIRGRVVDSKGRPVENATAVVERWRRNESIRFSSHTDPSGRFAWSDGPADEVAFMLYKRGYRQETRPIKASDGEVVLTLHPEFVISGRLTDATTGRPVESCRLTPGFRIHGARDLWWDAQRSRRCANGLYEFRSDLPYAAVALRFEAPGYRTAISSEIPITDKPQTRHFSLIPALPVSGIVLKRDRKPATGAYVVLSIDPPGGRLYSISLLNGHPNRLNVEQFRFTGPDGRFSFPPPEKGYLIYATSDDGYGYSEDRQFAKSAEIRLTPWGKIEGTIRIGRKPATNIEVTYGPGFTMTHGSYIGSTTTDTQGRFRFDRALPGPGAVDYFIQVDAPGSPIRLNAGQVAFNVRSGEITQVTFGEGGRSVIGRVEIPARLAREVGNKRGITSEIGIRVGARLGPPRFGFVVNEDGTFRVDNLPSGAYRLEVLIRRPPEDGDALFQMTPIGKASRDFEIPAAPPGQLDVPVDLGTIHPEIPPAVGEMAPDFKASALDEQRHIRLSDFRGKVVLLGLWWSNSQSCQAEMLEWKALCESPAADGKLALITISPFRWFNEKGQMVTFVTARQFIEAQRIPGNHAFDDLYAQAWGPLRRYGIAPFPSSTTYLIGADGRVIAKDLHGSELQESVKRALRMETFKRTIDRLPRRAHRLEEPKN